MNNRQLGRFSISEELVRNNPDLVARAFALFGIVPVRAESMFWNRSIEYVALCESFHEVPDGVTVTEYTLCITDDGSWLTEIDEL